MKRVRALCVGTTQGPAGTLAKDGTHVFSYDAATLAHGHDERAVSLTMPLRAAPWQSVPMLPAFQTFLPEGFLRERVQERFGKVVRMDAMAMLMLTGANAIGRLRVSAAPAGSQVDDSLPAAQPPVESLAEILSDQGSRDLFEHLCDRYLIASGIAGVQPKVLVDAVNDVQADPPQPMPASAPSRHAKPSLDERSTLRARRLIVKASGPDWQPTSFTACRSRGPPAWTCQPFRARPITAGSRSSASTSIPTQAAIWVSKTWCRCSGESTSTSTKAVTR